MRKLPGFQPAPAGLERAILRKLPTTLLAGTLLPALFALVAPVDPTQADTFRYVLIGMVLTHWMLVFGTAIVCLIVVVMKGHAWVADAYPLPDRDRPRPSVPDRVNH